MQNSEDILVQCSGAEVNTLSCVCGYNLASIFYSLTNSTSIRSLVCSFEAVFLVISFQHQSTESKEHIAGPMCTPI